MVHQREHEELAAAARHEIAKRDAEIERLRAIARDARDHVPWDVLKRIDAALGNVEQTAREKE